jgi:protein required for attachment to host cells
MKDYGGRTAHQYEELILVAAPHFIGLLRQCIDQRPLNSIPIHEVHKDYSQEKPQELPRLLNLK